MLASSAAFSDLRIAMRTTVGTVPGNSEYDFAKLVRDFDSSASITGKTKFEFDAPEQIVQQALLADVEKAYGKFVAQYITYGVLVEHEVEAVWRAVTAYYGCVYAATSLLAATGTTLRRLKPSGLVSGGLWSISTATPINPTTTPYLRVTGQKGGGVGSHARTWSVLQALLDRLVQVSPGSRGSHVLAAMSTLVSTIPSLSDFRNDINYSVDQGPWSRKIWPCILRDVSSEDDLEDALIAGVKCDEQRLELLMLTCGSLTRALLSDYYSSVTGVDYRPRAWRRRHVDNIVNTPFVRSRALVAD